MRQRMMWLATLAIVAVCTANWAVASPIRRVETAIAARITDRWGQPLPLPTGLQLVFFKFHAKAWAPEIWARVKTRTDSDGRWQAMAMFPVDSTFMMALVKYAAHRDRVKVDIGLQLLDQDGRAVHCPNGVRIELSRFGERAWAPGQSAVIVGDPDDTGRFWPKMDMPIDAVTLYNFTQLAKGHGK